MFFAELKIDTCCRITAILIARFILNLRESVLGENAEESTAPPQASLQFASSRVLGTIGGELDHGNDVEDDEEDDWDNSNDGQHVEELYEDASSHE